VRPSPGDRSLERAVLWSTTFHRLFGAACGREKLPGEVRPMSCGETSRVLESLQEPHTARHCLGHMLASGYVPDQHNAEQFRRLVCRSVPGKAPEDAMAELRERGLREHARPVGEDGVPELPSPRDAHPVPIAGPTVLKFEGQVFTAKKTVLVPARFERVRSLAEPRNWWKLGPFWEGRDGGPPIEEDWKPPKKARYKTGDVVEHFVINWNALRLEAFDVRLRATVQWDADTIHTAYSLIHDEGQAVLVDEGYGEVRRYGPGWTRYTGVKTLKFGSNLLNLLAPGVLAMVLDGIVPSFEKMFSRKRRRSTRRR